MSNSKAFRESQVVEALHNPDPKFVSQLVKFVRSDSTLTSKMLEENREKIAQSRNKSLDILEEFSTYINSAMSESIITEAQTIIKNLRYTIISEPYGYKSNPYFIFATYRLKVILSLPAERVETFFRQVPLIMDTNYDIVDRESIYVDDDDPDSRFYNDY